MVHGLVQFLPGDLRLAAVGHAYGIVQTSERGKIDFPFQKGQQEQ